ncbi:hypothetical protein NJB18091_13790 [Mycobacterium marinum]|nr:hypothetical protein NJB18091_13790 [Mycobacterium marinum]
MLWKAVLLTCRGGNRRLQILLTDRAAAEEFRDASARVGRSLIVDVLHCATAHFNPRSAHLRAKPVEPPFRLSRPNRIDCQANSSQSQIPCGRVIRVIRRCPRP